MRQRLVVWGLMLCVALWTASCLAEAPHEFVVSGVVVNSGNAKLMDRFVAELSRKSGYPLTPRFVATYSELSTILRQHPDALAWTCGGPFVEDSIKDGQQLISVPLLHGEPVYHSLIMTRKERPEKGLLDFKGQVLAYSDPRSNSGFIAPAYRLRQEGQNIYGFFRLLLHAGNHERSIEAVYHGLADVAAVDSYVWYEYAKQHPDIAGELKIIDELGPFPFTPIVAGSKVSAETIARLQNTLDEFYRTDNGQTLLTEFGLTIPSKA